MKTATLAAAAAVLLTSSLALADDRHFEGCERQHGHQAMPAFRAGGHYELQTTQQWVDGRYEQEWVAPVCTERRGHRRGWHRHHRNRTVCTQGYYTQVWRPGHYVTVQQWVFVRDFGRQDGYGRSQHRPYGTPPPPVSPIVYGQVQHGAVNATVTFGSY